MMGYILHTCHGGEGAELERDDAANLYYQNVIRF